MICCADHEDRSSHHVVVFDLLHPVPIGERTGEAGQSETPVYVYNRKQFLEIASYQWQFCKSPVIILLGHCSETSIL